MSIVRYINKLYKKILMSKLKILYINGNRPPPKFNRPISQLLSDLVAKLCLRESLVFGSRYSRSGREIEKINENKSKENYFRKANFRIFQSLINSGKKVQVSPSINGYIFSGSNQDIKCQLMIIFSGSHCPIKESISALINEACAKGFTVLCADYRGFGDNFSSISHVSERSLTEDVSDILNFAKLYINKNHLDKQMIVIGFSLGAPLAANGVRSLQPEDYKLILLHPLASLKKRAEEAFSIYVLKHFSGFLFSRFAEMDTYKNVQGLQIENLHIHAAANDECLSGHAEYLHKLFNASSLSRSSSTHFENADLFQADGFDEFLEGKMS